MTEYKVISGPGNAGLRHGVFELKEAGEGGSREVAKFYIDHEAAAYAAWRNEGAAPSPPSERAQEAREKVAALRMPHGEDSPFESRRRAGESLDPPTTVAAPPLAGGPCGDCGKMIEETDSWRPDPDATEFTPVHTDCIKRRGWPR